MIIANGRHRKGRHYYPLTRKKHLRAQEVARDKRLPCIYPVDSGGAFLPCKPRFFRTASISGASFYNQATMSAAGIPQIAVVHGLLHRRRRLRSAMSDETSSCATRAPFSSPARRW